MQTYDYIIRVSKTNGRDESAESTMTIADQRDAATEAIRGAGARIGVEHKALDESGFTAIDSRAYRAAVERIRHGQAHGLVVAYGDRLARNWRKVGRFYDELEQLGADVVIAGMPGVDYRSAAGRQITGMMAVMSEGYYFAAKERGDRIADRTVARGVHNRVPFGYRRNAGADGVKADPGRDGKALVPDPKTAPLLRRLFELRADGHTWAQLGRWLEYEDVRPPRGGHWTVSTLRNIIANEVYLGVVTLGKRRVEDAHEPLVSRSLWKTAQSSTSVQRTGRNAAGVAGGLLRCGSCGRPLSVTGTNPAYTCRRQLGGKPCERPVYVSKRRADAFVERAIVEVLEHGALEVVASSADLERVRRAFADAQLELENYVVEASSLEPRLFRLGLEAREQKLAAARCAHEDMVSRADVAAELPEASGWAALDLDGRRRVARALIVEIVVAPPESRRERGPHAGVEKRFTIRWNGAG
jgi:DNA invertase Pin-like site-specific DNA recombinase